MAAAKLSRGEREILRQSLESSIAAHRIRHELRSEYLRSRHGPAESIPERTRRAIRRAEAGRRRQAKKAPQARRVFLDRNDRSPLNWAALREYLLATMWTSFRLDQGVFVDLVGEGVSSGQAGDSRGVVDPKVAYAEAGLATLAGPEARAWNRRVFGFRTAFSLPPGSHHVVLSSDATFDFRFPDGWLEALSFGPSSIGEVTATAQVHVLTASGPFTSGVRAVLSASSPPGSSSGAIGVFNPTGEVRESSIAFGFDVVNPPSTWTVVTVFELAELIAERHGDPSRCNAAIWSTARWSPLGIAYS